MSAPNGPKIIVFGVRHDLVTGQEQKAKVVVNNVRAHLKKFKNKRRVAVELTPNELRFLRGVSANKLEKQLQQLENTPAEFRIGHLRFWHRIVWGLKKIAYLDPLEDPALQEEFHQAMEKGRSEMIASFRVRNQRIGEILSKGKHVAGLVGLRHIQEEEPKSLRTQVTEAFGEAARFKSHEWNEKKERYEMWQA